MPDDAESSDSLRGWNVDLDDEQLTLDALEKAFDYRGDITVLTSDGQSITGYIFDRRTVDSLEESTIRLLTAESDEPRSIRFSDIRRLEFSTRDPAHGKSFENWVKKYVEKKMKGEEASIY